MLLRKNLTALGSFFLLFGAEACLAELMERHSWEVGPEITHIEYKEPGVMKEEGMMYGLAGSYIFHHKAMAQADVRISYGQVDYSSPESGTMDDIDDMIMEFRGAGGYEFELSDSVVLTPFAGLGYRYLIDDSSGRRTSKGYYGYKRESNYYYTPVGLKFNLDIGWGWSFGASAEYDKFWFGMQKSYLSDVGAGYNDIENRQNSGYGYRGYIEVRKKVKKAAFSVRPLFKYWNIDESEHEDLKYNGTTIGEAWEPKNRSTEYGVALLARF